MQRNEPNLFLHQYHHQIQLHAGNLRTIPQKANMQSGILHKADNFFGNIPRVGALESTSFR